MRKYPKVVVTGRGMERLPMGIFHSNILKIKRIV